MKLLHGVFIFTIFFLTCTAPAVKKEKPVTTGDQPEKRPYSLFVTKQMVNLAQNTNGVFGQDALDSVPLLTIEDIKSLRYDPSNGVENAFELNPGVYDILKRKFASIGLHSFVIMLNKKIVYTGVLVPFDYSIDHLIKSQYVGLILLLPPQFYIPEKMDFIQISFISEDGIYNRAEDPRGNKEMLDFFKALGKFKY